MSTSFSPSLLGRPSTRRASFVLVALAWLGGVLATPSETRAQTVSDGPILVQVRVREINTTHPATDLAFFGVVGQPDEHTYYVRAREVGSFNGATWSAGSGCYTEDFDSPALSSDLNEVVFNRVYATTTPDGLQLGLDAWEDESADQLLGVGCEGTRCAYETGLCCGGYLFGACLGAIDDDDLRCDAAPFANIDYRLSHACTTHDHGFVTGTLTNSPNCAYYQPRVETFWRYLDGDTFAAPVELGALAQLGTFTHRNSTSTTCYGDDDGALATPDVFAAVDLAGARNVRIQVCTSGAPAGIAVFDGSGTLLGSSVDSCLVPFEMVACAGRLVIRVDAASAAGEPFTLTVSDVAVPSYPLAECCGDNMVDRGENCDDGNDDDTDACRNTCESARCGDGVVQTGVDACDDGTLNGQPNQCNLTCSGLTPSSCGNGVTEAGEVCDDGGDNGMPNECAADCGGITTPTCGNSVAEAGESCDDGTATATCDADCTMVSCGDAVVNTAAGETCDDGADNGLPTRCAANCMGTTPATCGNGTIEAGEDCDTAGESATCNVDCSMAMCGDGVLNTTASEVCDDGANNGMPTRCALDCAGTTVSVCGNGVVEAGETCDTGGPSEACDGDCSPAACGDGVVNAAAGELCDDGPDNGMPGRCAVGCVGRTSARCGDGALDDGEECDEGPDNGADGGTCTSACRLPVPPGRLAGGSCGIASTGSSTGWALGSLLVAGLVVLWRRRSSRCSAALYRPSRGGRSARRS